MPSTPLGIINCTLSNNSKDKKKILYAPTASVMGIQFYHYFLI